MVYVNLSVTFSVCITLGWSSHTMVIHGQQNQDGKIITIHWKQNKILKPDSRMNNLHHDCPHMLKAGWVATQFHWKQNNTKCQWQYCENTETHSKGRMMPVHILGAASANHTNTWTLYEPWRGLFKAESIWTDSSRTLSNQQHKYN